jgi:hypothetical protein
MFFLQQNWRTRGQNRLCQDVGVGKRWPKKCIHVIKCKNDKIKSEKRR